MDSSYIKQQAGAATQSFSQQDGMPSWRAGAVFKPLPEGSLYAAFGNSYDPSAEQLSLSSATAGLPPEASTTSEIGVKWQLCHQQLLLSGALFKDEQANTRIPDPNNPLLDIDAGDELAQGWEVSASGRLARAWRLLAAYTHTDSQYVSYASGGHDFSGLPLAGTPQQSLNLWSALDLPWGFQLGAGAQALSGRNAGAFASNGSLEAVPGYAIYNAMLGWRPAKGLGIQLNVNNATNLSYISGVDDSHITPGAARAFILSGAMEY
jgi:catecholate siderophore receptor